MTDFTVRTEDGKGRQIKPILCNTERDGSGDWYFPFTAIETPVAFTGTSKTASNLVVAANVKREYLLIQNTTTVACYLAFGEAAVVGKGILLPTTGSAYEMSRLLGNLNLAAIYSINATGDQILCGLESSSV